MLAYFMYMVLICCYTGAFRELERYSFYKSETPYTTVYFWVEQVLMKYNPPMWCSRRNIRRKVLAEIYEPFSTESLILVQPE